MALEITLKPGLKSQADLPSWGGNDPIAPVKPGGGGGKAPAVSWGGDDPVAKAQPSTMESIGYIGHRGVDALATLPGAPADIAVGIGNLISRQFGGPQATDSGPLGSEAIHGMLHDVTGYEAPREAANAFERYGGNIAGFIGAGAGVGGLTKAALRSGILGGGALSITQDVAPDNVPLQVSAAIAAGHSPQAAGLVGKLARGAMRGGGTSAQNMTDTLAAFDRLRQRSGQPGPARVTAGQAAPGYNTSQALDAMMARLPGGQPDYMTTFAEQARTDQGAVENTAMNPTGRGAQQRLPNVNTAGDAIREGFAKFVENFKGKARQYEQGFEQHIGTQSRTPVTNTQRALAELKAKAQTDPAIQKLVADPYVRALDEAVNTATSGLVNVGGTQIASGAAPTLGFGALRALRSDVGELLGKAGLSPSIKEGQLKRLYEALTQDLTEAANSAGVGKQWAQYNQWYASGMRRIEQTLDRTVKGRESAPNAIFDQVMRMGRRQAFQTMRSLGDEQQAIVVGQALQELGFTAAAGAAADATNFSYAQFLNRLSKMRKAGTFDAIFGGKQFAPVRKLIDDLERSADAQARYAKIAHDVSGAATIRGGTLMSAGGLLFTGQPLAAAGLLAVAFIPPKLGAMLLRNRAFLSWLANTKNVPPTQWGEYIARLHAATRSDPAITKAVDQYIYGIQQSLAPKPKPQAAMSPSNYSSNGIGGTDEPAQPFNSSLPQLPENYDYAHPIGGFTPERAQPTMTNGDPEQARLAAQFDEETARRNQSERAVINRIPAEGESFLPNVSQPVSELRYRRPQDRPKLGINEADFAALPQGTPRSASGAGRSDAVASAYRGIKYQRELKQAQAHNDAVSRQLADINQTFNEINVQIAGQKARRELSVAQNLGEDRALRAKTYSLAESNRQMNDQEQARVEEALRERQVQVANLRRKIVGLLESLGTPNKRYADVPSSSSIRNP